MTTIQAYRRTIPYTHQFIGEAPIHFKPNERGDIVADVPEQRAVERLLAIPTGFRVYPLAAQADAEVVILPPSPVLSPVLTQETTEPESGNSSTEPEPEPATDEQPEPATEAEVHPYVLVDGEDSFDLRPLDDAALREFAKANGIQVPKKATGDAIRDAIVAVLQPKA